MDKLSRRGGGWAVRLARAYDNCLQRHPLATKAATAGVVGAAGDLLAQTVLAPGPNADLLREGTGKRTGIDWARNARFLVAGCCIIGPTLHVWYGLLGKAIVGNSVKATVARVGLDQFLFAPLFLGFFFPCLAAMEGRTLEDSMDQLKEIWLPSVVSNWVWWIPVQVVNFGIIPMRYQVLFSNGAGVVWNSYLSFVSQEKNK